MFTILLLTLVACEELVELPVGDPQLVVEGWVTNENKAHRIRLSQTVPFDAERDGLPVSDATLSIEDNLGNSWDCVHSADGWYESQVFTGVVGRNYQLFVVLADEQMVVSEPETLRPVDPLQSLSFTSFDTNDEQTGDPVTKFYPVVVSTDPLATKDFYRYIGFRNGEKFNDPDQLILLSDQFINGADPLVNELQLFNYDAGDSVRIELWSLTVGAFNFLELIRSQTATLGTTAGVGPATASGNLRYTDPATDNVVLGYFGASSITSISGVVE